MTKTMRRRGMILGVLLVAVPLAMTSACAGSSDAPASQSDDFTAAQNTDVQVVSVKTFGALQWGVGGGSIDASKCSYSDRKATPSSNEFTSSAKADCTNALAELRAPPVNEYREPLAWI